MRVEVRLAGVGGQGVVLAGRVLGLAAFLQGFFVVQTQSYGARVRGSPVWSDVIISDKPVGFPFVRKCDILLAMHGKALQASLPLLKENGTLIIDTSKAAPPTGLKAKILEIPAEKASKQKFGTPIYANMIMLGFLSTKTNIVDETNLKKAVEKTVEQNLKANLEALELGLRRASSLT